MGNLRCCLRGSVDIGLFCEAWNFSSCGSLKQQVLTAFPFWCYTALSPSTQAQNDCKGERNVVKIIVDISFPRILITVCSFQQYCTAFVYSILGIFPFTSSLS